MPGVNRVTIIGNLGRDVEMRYTASGAAVATFSVGVTDGYGERQHTEWFNCVAWNKLAETCASYLQKGRQVYIEGRLQTRNWESDGQKHYRTELVAQQVQFLGTGKGPANDSVTDVELDDIPMADD